MLSSAVRSYNDVELYARALPNSAVDFTVTKRGEFRARTTLITLHDIGVQRFADNLPRVAYASLPPGRAIISFRTEPGPDLVWGGQQLLPGNILWHPLRSSSFQRSSGAAGWGSVSASVEMMSSVVATLAGRDLTSPRHSTVVVPSAIAMARLQRLHAACAALAEDAPELLANPDAARGLEQALIGAMADCLGRADGRDEREGIHRHAGVMRRFRAFIEANADRALYMAEISTAIGVSGRVLRHCCKEHLGMGANQYLMVRRMHLARRALRQSNPDRFTVTEAATRYGFWELGRFSVGYKSLFGEMPSQTLRGARGSPAQ